ncbi:ribonuclease H-like domain-containing protein [Mycena maculata]|uniref:Ribonuclease H-like domain-containing protein n=1 Tax=Mycena maculata TaxID=230809 RepID=A0AAD7J815_9AGAR|nr:ribonuclease H-like domain-containing protein [Mycena maculata]
MSFWGQEHFRQGKVKYKNDKSHWESRCKACIARRVRELRDADEAEVIAGLREYVRSPTELDTQAEEDVPPVSGKLERWLSHLSRCDSVPPELQALTKAASKKENANGPGIRLSRVQDAARAATILPSPHPRLTLNGPGPSRHHAPPSSILNARMTLDVPHAICEPQASSLRYGVMWEPPKQEEFAQDLCKLFVACNISWNSAANPQLNLFFSKYVPEAKIPDRRVLSGRVLDSLALQAETGMKSIVTGRLSTGQCDGWKSSAKAAIITTSVTVDIQLYMIAAHDVSPERKTADNLLQIVLEDMEYCEELGIIMIAYCTDDGGDARGMRVRLKRVKPKLLVPPCWGHQVNLIVAEVLELDVPCMLSIDDGLNIVKWFTNHSRAIGLLNEEQKLTERFEKTHRLLRLIFPVISCWIYHFLAVRWILTLSPPMRTLHFNHHDKLIECAGPKRDARAKAEKILAPIEDPQFWKNLAEVKILLEPLAIAAKCMQAPDAGLDQVLLMLGNLYRIYGSPKINSRVRSCVRKSLEKRWLAMEREVFILAVYLNPYIRGSAFSPKNPALKVISLYNVAKRLFQGPAGIFLKVYETQMKLLYERENKRVNVAKVWEQLDTGEANGRNGLVKLAIWILSIIANSAGSERGYSKFGLFLTKLRSQLSIQKVRKMTTVDMDLKRQHEELGLTTDRIKRKFVHFAEQYVDVGNGAQAMDYDEADSFVSLTTQLRDDLTNSRDVPPDEEEEDDEEAMPAVHSQSNYTLKELFQYPTDNTESLENGLGFHWQGGVKDLQDEMELYDLLMEEFDL